MLHVILATRLSVQTVQEYLYGGIGFQ